MSSLIRYKVLGAKRARTCSALCYNAKHPACSCICDGANHSKGLLGAAEMTRVQRGYITEMYPEAQFSKEVYQMGLRI